MRFCLSLFTSLLLINTFSGCKRDSQKTEPDILIENAFASSVGWTYEVREGSEYVERPSSEVISNGALNESLYQGEGCARSRLYRSVETEFTSLEWAASDTLSLRLIGLSCDLTAIGGASLELAFGDHQLDLYIPYLPEQNEVKIDVVNDQVVQFLIDGEESTSSIEPEVINLSSPAYKMQFNFDACGADLYAGIEVEVSDLQISRIKAQE